MLLLDMEVKETSEMDRFLKTCDDGQSPKNGLHRFILPPPWMREDSAYSDETTQSAKPVPVHMFLFSFLNIKTQHSQHTT